jgi:hypothetical protein
MTATADQDASAALSASREVVRNAAKWFFAGLGGIGVVLVAGSQLSSIGALPPTSPRLYIALAGVVVGLGAILWAMWRVVDVLAGRRWAFEDVVREWNDVAQVPAQGFRNWRKRTKHPTGWFLHEHPSLLGNFESPVEIMEEYKKSEPGRPGLDDLVNLMTGLQDKISTIYLTERFRALRGQIGGGIVIGAAGIILFAWAANPTKLDQPIPSLAHANLRDADLRGASLRNVDLTGADLTGADLNGSDMRGATITGTTWLHTICPDGTNSDAGSRPDVTGRPAGSTCQDHLVPAGY